MSLSKKRVVDCKVSWSIDRPPKRRKKTETLRYILDVSGDDSIDTIRSRRINKRWTSPKFKAHGYIWIIGVTIVNRNVGMFLQLDENGERNNNTAVHASCSFRCHGIQTPDKACFFDNTKRLDHYYHQDLDSFLSDDGKLVIEADIKLVGSTKKYVWYPEFQKNDFLKQLYEDESDETTDVIFSVEEESYHLHKSVLYRLAKKLYELATEYGDTNGDEVYVSIPGMKSEVFKQLLEFVYAVKAPVFKTDNNAIELLAAADRFECIQLKLYVESVLVDKFLEVRNAASLLLLAESHSCALLKEAAIDLITIESEEVRKSKEWPQIQGSPELLNELFDSLSKRSYNLETGYGSKTCRKGQMWRENMYGVQWHLWDITDLRKCLQDHDLPLDGSRKILVDRLKAYKEANPKEAL